MLGVAVVLLWIYFGHSTVQIAENAPFSQSQNNDNASADLPILAYCELANNPDEYDGKIVRLSARLLIGVEGSWISDSNCGRTDNAAITTSNNEEVWHSINQARKQKGKKIWSNEVNLIVVGKFKNAVYKDCCLITPFQFEIMRIEKASETY